MISISACSALTQSDKPATKRWWLEPYQVEVAGNPAGMPETVVLSVTAIPGLDTDRILTLSDDAELSQFAAARWVDHLPELVTSLIERSLQATGQFEVVTERTASRPGNCLLELELREFFADIAPGGALSTVRVAIKGSFRCESTAPVVFQSGASVPIASERMSAVVAAFQQAMDSVTLDIVNKIQ